MWSAISSFLQIESCISSQLNKFESFLYLQVQPVSKSKLQLVGVTSMLIAAKYEEMYPPEIGDFVYITDNAYTKAQIRSMECHILRRLDFSLGKPLCIHFLRRNSKAGGVRYYFKYLAQ